jgi:hypothetical protein
MKFSVKTLDLRAGGSVAALVILPTVLRVAQQFSVGVAGHAVPWAMALLTELGFNFEICIISLLVMSKY